ncbi:putative bifunctional diguanylate cyclase/phosphodiesterase [Paractinoplanes rishiriensis]|uniref:putative bifunctional diguanylate cyclase/phosphodiesterase n=1 Tax=Paractinoplanes rishiriensis TaxID=1050105 RepID=UPI001EF2C921|nr:EAL domain-containing protein [Actinoplanes rishiriensis]
MRTGALLSGLLILLLSVVTSVVGARDRQVTAQDTQLRQVVDQRVDSLENYFERARSISALLAANPVFTDFYRTPGTTPEKIRRINDALVSLQSLFPGRIHKASFIDESGAEVARVVDGVPATPAALSRAENDHAFFARTLQLGPGQVFQSEEYLSPDTHDEVIANSAAVTAGGHTGMVHFEIALAGLHTPPAGGISTSIIDAASGRAVVGEPDTAVPTTGVAEGVVTSGTRRVAFRRLAATDGNANDWYVAVSAPAFDAGWTRGFGVGSLALLAGAVLAILLAAIGSWLQRRSARKAASHDPLTGLPNRALLIERIRAASAGNRPVAVLVSDLERFKEVNDLLGHRYGDLLLRQVAARLRAAAPENATVARLGGDDFALLVPGADAAAAEAVAVQMLAALHRTFPLGGTGVDLEARIGVALGPEHGAEADVLLRRADAAMRVAKEQHEGHRTYDATADQHASNRLALLGDLRRAFDADDQIVLHYQPKVHLADGTPAGVEALVRWEHPTLGRMSPDTFIPLAETTTLVHVLTERVLRIAVRQAAEWRRDGVHLPVAVNLSARCLHDESLPDRVFDLLRRADLPPDVLKLEITESMVMADPERAQAVLRVLHDGGIQLSIDDFGTGHSSMAYLQKLPLDEMKIDRSFVRQLEPGQGDEVLVRSAITLGHSLGLTVVAEGVEDQTTMDRLRELGCDIAQGYHLGRPMPAAEIGPWLTARGVEVAA